MFSHPQSLSVHERQHNSTRHLCGFNGQQTPTPIPPCSSRCQPPLSSAVTQGTPPEPPHPDRQRLNEPSTCMHTPMPGHQQTSLHTCATTLQLCRSWNPNSNTPTLSPPMRQYSSTPNSNTPTLLSLSLRVSEWQEFMGQYISPMTVDPS